MATKSKPKTDEKKPDAAPAAAETTNPTDKPAAAPPQAAEKPKKPKKAKAIAVLEVRPGRVLSWPNGDRRGMGSAVEGELGYCVRADDPFLQGFEHVLRPAPKGSRPSTVEHGAYSRQLSGMVSTGQLPPFPDDLITEPATKPNSRAAKARERVGKTDSSGIQDADA